MQRCGKHNLLTLEPITIPCPFCCQTFDGWQFLTPHIRLRHRDWWSKLDHPLADIICIFNGLGVAVRYQLCMWWCRYTSSNNVHYYQRQMLLAAQNKVMPKMRWSAAAFEKARAHEVMNKEKDYRLRNVLPLFWAGQGPHQIRRIRRSHEAARAQLRSGHALSVSR